jgi:hypothetical protein
MLIEVSEIHPPRPGGKVSRIVAADGQHYQIWPEKLVGVDVGRRYEIEATDREFNGHTFKSIKSIVPVAEPPSGKVGHISSQASLDLGEAEFVGRTIAALIIKGEIGASQIAKTTARLREIWRETDLPGTAG